jgi:hypothetical protein
MNTLHGCGTDDKCCLNTLKTIVLTVLNNNNINNKLMFKYLIFSTSNIFTVWDCEKVCNGWMVDGGGSYQ